MSDRGEPLYRSRPVGPESARFGWCRRFNDFICLSEGNSNTYLIETAEATTLIDDQAYEPTLVCQLLKT